MQSHLGLPLQLCGIVCTEVSLIEYLCSAWDLEKCLTSCVLPLGGKNMLTWFDEFSVKGLAAALGIGIRLYNISCGNRGPMQLTYPADSEASFNLIKHGVHYDLVH